MKFRGAVLAEDMYKIYVQEDQQTKFKSIISPSCLVLEPLRSLNLMIQLSLVCEHEEEVIMYSVHKKQ